MEAEDDEPAPVFTVSLNRRKIRHNFVLTIQLPFSCDPHSAPPSLSSFDSFVATIPESQRDTVIASIQEMCRACDSLESLPFDSDTLQAVLTQFSWGGGG